MYEYLNDMDFLMALDKLHMRTQYARIILLDFQERPIKEIQGQITAGTLNVNGSSAVRRTLSLTMMADAANIDIQDVDNEISINKKVKVEVGFKNPLKSYASYGDIIWFPCGMFVLSSANTSRSTSSVQISISGKDKMCCLDGTVGGTLPATTIFHEKFIEQDNGDIIVQYPTIFQIIFEAVHHWGGQPAEQIVISDLDEEVKMLVKYNGSRPVYFNDTYSGLSFTYDEKNFMHQVSNGDDAGYELTDFTFPGELVLETQQLPCQIRLLGYQGIMSIFLMLMVSLFSSR